MIKKPILILIAIFFLSTQLIFSVDSIVPVRHKKKHHSKKQQLVPTYAHIPLLSNEQYTAWDVTFQLLKQRNAKILVTTGPALQSAEWAKSHDAQVFSLEMDANMFLDAFDQPIDFLYLDKQDHFKELVAIYPHLRTHSVVMIDTSLSYREKLAVDWLQAKGWKILISHSQTVLVKEWLAHNCLDDPQDLEQYISAFPREEYIICETPYQGKFYVEPHRNDVIKNHLKVGMVWDPHILEKIHQYVKPGTVALDIGAHIGTFTIAMAKIVGKNGTIYAFEPQKKIFRELNKNCELNDVKNVVCHRLAIGDREQVIEMDKETFPGNEGSTNIGHGGDLAEMRTIDAFHFKNVSFIKIDVERTEEQVLDGMVHTIQDNQPVIVIELQGGYLLETAPSNIKEKILNSMSKLQSLGYVVTRIHQHDYLALPTREKDD